jgi:hypothetical protein
VKPDEKKARAFQAELNRYWHSDTQRCLDLYHNETDPTVKEVMRLGLISACQYDLEMCANIKTRTPDSSYVMHDAPDGATAKKDDISVEEYAAATQKILDALLREKPEAGAA